VFVVWGGFMCWGGGVLMFCVCVMCVGYLFVWEFLMLGESFWVRAGRKRGQVKIPLGPSVLFAGGGGRRRRALEEDRSSIKMEVFVARGRRTRGARAFRQVSSCGGGVVGRCERLVVGTRPLQ